jgi:hypothetical protein
MIMNEMNDIAKRSAAERLKKAMDLEKMGPSEAARHLNILGQYISMSKQEKFWPKMPKSAWDRILFWCNSGETIHHFKLPSDEIILQPKAKVEKGIIPDGNFIKNQKQIIDSVNKIIAPLAVEKAKPDPGQDFTDTARLKVCLDIEINLVINGQKVQVK